MLSCDCNRGLRQASAARAAAQRSTHRACEQQAISRAREPLNRPVRVLAHHTCVHDTNCGVRVALRDIAAASRTQHLVGQDGDDANDAVATAGHHNIVVQRKQRVHAGWVAGEAVGDVFNVAVVEDVEHALLRAAHHLAPALHQSHCAGRRQDVAAGGQLGVRCARIRHRCCGLRNLSIQLRPKPLSGASQTLGIIAGRRCNAQPTDAAA